MAHPEANAPDHPLLSYRPQRRRRLLLAFPRYTPSFGTFNHAYGIMNVKAFMPPQGILLIASLLPPEWEYRLIDENIQPVRDADIAWADVVFTSGMHIQRARIDDLTARAHAMGKVVALGGPSVSAAPEYYPEVDLLHVGEAGDGTLKLFEHLDRSVERPAQQLTFQTVNRVPMKQFPTPDYDSVNVMQYLLGSVQFSSGCPFTCEFCDIPALYGRNPRLKDPDQIVAELDTMAERGQMSAYFVDDNFVGNPNATRELLPKLIKWQKKRDYQMRLACEATLNMVKYPDLLKMMQEAGFVNCFMGIETPEPTALKAMKKVQNLRTPILDAVAMMNSYGMEVASGIIMGLDTDTPETPQAIIDFARASNIPIMTVNIVYALPHTALFARLEKAGRILSEEEAAGRDSNVRFLQPYEEVVGGWRRVIEEIYDPAFLYQRYQYNIENTYRHQVKPANPAAQATPRNLKRALRIAASLVWNAGIKDDYRRHFWKMAIEQGKRGHIELIFQIGMVAHHLISYGREVVADRLQASNYSPRNVEHHPAAEPIPEQEAAAA
ncbi:MAG: B12-binding domain-containing radical SAM protein [Verrucomicrobiota bacterium]